VKNNIKICFFLIVPAALRMASQNAGRTETAEIAKIDVKHIRLELNFEWNNKRVTGTATIHLSLLQGSDHINLDAGYLSINSVSSEKGKNLVFEYDSTAKNNGLKIFLGKPYLAGDSTIVKISYHSNYVNAIDPTYLSGTNGKGLRFSMPTTNDPIKPKEIWSIGDPESNRYWFPCHDTPADLRSTELIATVNEPLMVISNGVLVKKAQNPNGTTTFHYRTATPYANHLTSLVVGEFVDVKQTYNGIELHNYGYTNEKTSIQATVERLPDMLRYFSEVTGQQYPYPAYSQAFVQDIGSYTSNQSLSTITENMIDDKGTHDDFFYLWDQTEAEALAAQWFGNLLQVATWEHVWLNKSFAHYFNQLYNEHKNGRDEFLLYQLAFDQSVYLNDWSSGYRHPVVTSKIEDVLQFTTDNYATTRGSLVLNMLRHEIGEENWWKAIRIYVASNAGKQVTTKDFISAVEQATQKQMSWFFDQWIFKMGHPVFKVTKTYDAAQQLLSLKVCQTQQPDTANTYPLNSYFQGKVRIEIDDEIKEVLISPTAENNYSFSLLSPPLLVNFDFGSCWIKEISFEKSPEELLYQLKHSKDVLAKQQAIAELGKIAADPGTPSDLSRQITFALRQLITSDNYWRLKTSAISQLRTLFQSHGTKPDDTTASLMLQIVEKERSWLKASAITLLGTSLDKKYTPVYLKALKDPSDRVVSAAALALGKTKSPVAFEALSKLVNRPSMKSQSLLSALSGLKELGDPRGFEIAFKALSDLKLPRWRLPDGSVWDFRIFAAATIKSLGRSDSAFPMILNRLKTALAENDVNGTFSNLLIIHELADPRGQQAFELLRSRYKDNSYMTGVIEMYENNFRNSISTNNTKK